MAEAKAKAEEFGGFVEQSPGPPRPVEADTSKKVADSVLFQLWFSVSVSVTVVIFQLQFTVVYSLQLLFFSFYFYFS